MPDDDRRDGLRIGGWVPPYRDAAGPLDPPVLRPPMAAVKRVGVIAGLPRAVVATGPRRRTLLAAAVFALVLTVASLLTLGDDDRPAPSATPADRMVLPVGPEPSAPVSVLPPPVVPSAAPSPVETTTPATRRPSRSRTPATTPATRATTPAAALAVGATVGLEVAGRPGERLRHRDFRARIDRVTSTSSALARADSSFTVRSGLSSSRCVSLESVNYPGYFLRHSDYVLRLDRRDRSELFARDATFCPEPVGGGVVLRSLNYPDLLLSAGRDGVRLSRSGATTFVPRAAL